MEAWKPYDLILTSRQKVRDRDQRLLFERNEKNFPSLYYTAPKTLGGKTSWSPSPGPCWMAARPAGARPERRRRRGALEICPRGPRRQVGPGWALGYATTVHSSQGLTVADPQKVWIIDDYLQWSNLSYLAVSRVEYMHQLERVVCPPKEGSEGARSAKLSGGSWWPISDRTRPRGSGLA